MNSRNITVELAPARNGAVEVVERKGLGHPDSICDGIAEEISVALCREYIERTGSVLHHNVDKLLLAAGEANVHFGGGEITKPITLVLGGRAIAATKDFELDVHHLAAKTAREYLKKAVRHLDVEDDVEIESKIGRGSADLVDVFKRKGKKSSNDTSFGTGYAPLSVLEETVLGIEQRLNSDEFKYKHPYVGEDIKIMGLREHSKIRISVACAFVARHLKNMAAYKEAVEVLRAEALRVTEKIEHKDEHEIDVVVNTADDYASESVYITHTGTSAENGDDGSVGRGNRVNGLITPMRPMSLEAAAGKNPVTHVGKIYNVAAFKMAQAIVKAYPAEIRNVDVVLLSQIGKPVNQPKEAGIKISADEADYARIRKGVQDVVDGELENIGDVTQLIIDKKATTF